MKPRGAVLLGALVLFLLGLAAMWRLGRGGHVEGSPQVAPATSGAASAPTGPSAPPSRPAPALGSATPSRDQAIAPVPQPRPMAQAPAVASRAPAPSPAVGPASAEEIAAAKIEVDQVSLMFRDYRSRMGTNPVGTNAEIMQAVMGGNPKGARLGPPEGQNLNAKGELVDRWGTAYFFHQMSATHMEIHSAGPDKVFGTEDDVVQK